jgi:NADPH-dependent 2,4-dienoyl-CoA reductase/sulfur reductase-like enzyme
MTGRPIIVLGGGIAGFKALRRIHELAPHRDVILVSDESATACERPMLSKEALVSTTGLRSVGAPASDRVTVLSQRGLQIDRARRSLILQDGTSLDYDRLILATGSRPRRLPEDMVSADVHYLRTEADADALATKLSSGRRIVIIGGGFIGLEVACAAWAKGASATVLEMSPILLARVAPASVAEHLLDLHKAQGVEIVTDTRVLRVAGRPDGTAVVETAQGHWLADCVVAGIGVLPNVELAEACGLHTDNGIVVDTMCRTSDPFILAAGEVTNYPVPSLGLRTRSESWTVAADQGEAAGEAALASGGPGYTNLPWLWSDQFGTSIQYLGLPMSAPSLRRFQGAAAGGWLELGLDGRGAFVGAIGVNANREIAELRRAMAKGFPLPQRYLEHLEA